MNFIKKQAAGFYLMLLALILGTAGIVFYVINCNTAYFFKLGISWGVVGCFGKRYSDRRRLLSMDEYIQPRRRTGKVAGNAGTGYSSDSGGSAFDGRICIFCPPESEQHCDYFII